MVTLSPIAQIQKLRLCRIKQRVHIYTMSRDFTQADMVTKPYSCRPAGEAET